ncbi:glutamate ligase domain-containing protein [Spiroplasma endosymbiont of Amphibalanus improvisus]|uniref:glutamate ligase domain-containing protein n=1 Tax=Spiroplasma endosymbiont of Amphibalanus improvisus TaxID=3066327 RepID=UPI00313D9C2E
MKVDVPIFNNSFFSNKHNLKKLLLKFNNPQDNLEVINIVGTNGKGSTSTALNAQLMFNNKKVGLFISPAFFEHNERIQINSIPITDEIIYKYIDCYKKDWEEYNLNFFEIFLFIAIFYFVDNKIDIAVIEAGIGGARDCTSIFQNQKAVLLTSVSLDHTEILGNSIKQIIENKVGILKANKKIYCANSNFKYLNIIKKLITADQLIICDLYNKILDKNQQDNLGIVVKYCLDNNYKINTEILEKQKLIGRYMKLRDEPLFLIDGAHNIDGVKKLFSNLKPIENKNLIYVFGTSIKKDFNSMINFFKENNLKVHLTNFEHDKSWNISEIDYPYKIDNWKQFLKNNFSQNIIVFGSLYFIPLVYNFYYTL